MKVQLYYFQKIVLSAMSVQLHRGKDSLDNLLPEKINAIDSELFTKLLDLSSSETNSTSLRRL